MEQVNFINVGRGKTVNEVDLLLAIKNNHLNYAILDVQALEPLPSNSPLYNEKKNNYYSSYFWYSRYR